MKNSGRKAAAVFLFTEYAGEPCVIQYIIFREKVVLNIPILLQIISRNTAYAGLFFEKGDGSPSLRLLMIFIMCRARGRASTRKPRPSEKA